RASMRASTSVSKSALAGAGAVDSAANTASFRSAAHSSGKLGGAASWAPAPLAAAMHSVGMARRSVLPDRETILVLRFCIEQLVLIAGAPNPYTPSCSACHGQAP